MPIHSCKLPSGGSGYKWGNSGHCYASRADALKQMRAIFHSGYKGEGQAKAEINWDTEIDALSDEDLDLFCEAAAKVPLVVSCTADGKTGWKANHSTGHCYPGKEGKKLAIKQAIKINYMKAKEGKASLEDEFFKALAERLPKT